MQRLFTIPCNIYRPAGLGDCTNRGATSTGADVERVVLIGPDGPDPQDDHLRYRIPAMRLQQRSNGYLYAVPVSTPNSINGEPVVGPMMGGNFLFSNGSDFERCVGILYPIPAHDRFEPASWSKGMD
jgi:hypothetical protein